MKLEERRRLADANLVATFALTRDYISRTPGGTAMFGAVRAVATGVDIAFFNPVLAFDPRAEPDDIGAAIDWIDAMGLPVSVQLRDDASEAARERVAAAGLVVDERPTPVLALDPIPTGVAVDGAAVVRTGGLDLFDEFHAGYESDDAFRQIFGPAFLADARVRVAVAELDGEPVASACAVGFEQTLGLYAVGTREHARRRGLGRAVTWAAIEAGRQAWGSTIAILQSSDMGLPVYRSLGFEVIGHYREHARPET